MRRLPPIALPLLALVLALPGCGAGKDQGASFSGERAQVAQTIEDLQSATRKRDAKRICTELLASATAQAVQGGCEQQVKDSINDVTDEQIDVKTVSVSGDKATATVVSKSGAKDVTDTIALVRERGRWRIASLGS